MRSGEDICIQQLHFRSVTNISGGGCNSLINFNDFKWRYRLLDYIPILQSFSGQYLCPDDPANSVAAIA